jgi:hypothetical protein
MSRTCSKVECLLPDKDDTVRVARRLRTSDRSFGNWDIQRPISGDRAPGTVNVRDCKRSCARIASGNDVGMAVGETRVRLTRRVRFAISLTNSSKFDILPTSNVKSSSLEFMNMSECLSPAEDSQRHTSDLRLGKRYWRGTVGIMRKIDGETLLADSLYFKEFQSAKIEKEMKDSTYGNLLNPICVVKNTAPIGLTGCLGLGRRLFSVIKYKATSLPGLDRGA